MSLPQEIKQAVFAGTGGHLAAIISMKNDADEVQDDLTLIDSQTGEFRKRVPFLQRLSAPAVSSDRRLVAIGGADLMVRVFDAGTLEERFSYRAHDAEITALAFHPQRSVLATGSADGSVKLWDYEASRLRVSFPGFTGTPVSLAFSPKGRLLSAESVENNMRLFDLGEE